MLLNDSAIVLALHGMSQSEFVSAIYDFLKYARLASVIIGLVVAYCMEARAKRVGRRGILCYWHAVHVATIYAVNIAAFLIVYMVHPLYYYGRLIPPTCAARTPYEGPKTFPCICKDMGLWLFRWSIGIRGEDLGPFDHTRWKPWLVCGGFFLAALVGLILMPIEEMAGSEEKAVSPPEKASGSRCPSCQQIIETSAV